MKTFEFEGVELTDETVLFKAIVSTRTADPKRLEDLRELLIESVASFITARKSVENLEYKEDPEAIHDKLSILHNYSGALLGLADSVHRRIKSRSYLDLLVVEPGEKAPTHDIREYHAREASCDLEGLIRMLDTNQRNILESMSVQSGMIKRR